MSNSEESCGCACGDGDNRIAFACAGVANVGQLSLQSIIRASKKRVATPSCLAGMGADHQGFVVAAKDADASIVIDGCPVACGRAIFRRHGLTPSVHIVLTEHGFKKGSDSYGEIDADRVVAIIETQLAQAACTIKGGS